MDLVFKWCAENNAHYYAEDRENFSKIDASFEAHAKGMNIVVVEDLS